MFVSVLFIDAITVTALTPILFAITYLTAVIIVMKTTVTIQCNLHQVNAYLRKSN